MDRSLSSRALVGLLLALVPLQVRAATRPAIACLDAKGRVTAIAGDLGPRGGDSPVQAALRVARENAQLLDVPPPAIDPECADLLADGPVRLVRFLTRHPTGRTPEGEVEVVFDRGGSAVAVAVSRTVEGRAVALRTPRSRAPRPSAATPPGTTGTARVFDSDPAGRFSTANLVDAVRAIPVVERPLPDLVDPRRLDGIHLRVVRRAGKGARGQGFRFAFDPGPTLGSRPDGAAIELDPSFVEANAYYHAARSRDEVVRTGAGALLDDALGRLTVVVDERTMPSGRPLAADAYYSSPTRSLHFAARDRFPAPADRTVVCHEYGHAVYHALVGEEPDKGGNPDQLAVYEGFSDAFAALVTGSPRFGLLWLVASGDKPRDAVNSLVFDPADDGDPHARGRVVSGLFADLGREFAHDDLARLLVGSLLLAPRPVDFHTLAVGLVLADRVLLAGRYHATVAERLARRRLPIGIAAVPASLR